MPSCSVLSLFTAMANGTTAVTTSIPSLGISPVNADGNGISLDGDILFPTASITVINVNPGVPEPGTMLLSGIGALGMFGASWYRRRRQAAK